MNNMTQLHIKNKYYIDVQKTSSGCIVKTPGNILSSPQFLPETTEYKIENNILSVNRADYVIPNYAIRGVILVDIMMKVTKLGLPLDLVLYFDGLTQKKGLLEIIDAPKNLEEKNKDGLLFKNLADIMLGGFDSEDAKKNEIGIGYNLIYQICEKGGI